MRLSSTCKVWELAFSRTLPFGGMRSSEAVSKARKLRAACGRAEHGRTHMLDSTDGCCVVDDDSTPLAGWRTRARRGREEAHPGVACTATTVRRGCRARERPQVCCGEVQGRATAPSLVLIVSAVMRLDANSLARQDVNVRFVMASYGHARSMLARCSIVDATPTRTSPTVNQSLILESRIFTPSRTTR